MGSRITMACCASLTSIHQPHFPTSMHWDKGVFLFFTRTDIDRSTDKPFTAAQMFIPTPASTRNIRSDLLYSPPSTLHIVYLFVCIYIHLSGKKILMSSFMSTTIFLIIAFYYSCSVQLHCRAWATMRPGLGVGLREKGKQIQYYIIIWGARLFLLC